MDGEFKRSQEGFYKADKELREKYKEFMGHDSSDLSVVELSRDELIEKYAKLLLFWSNEKPQYFDVSDYYITSKIQICDQGLIKACGRISHFNINEEVKDYLLNLIN